MILKARAISDHGPSGHLLLHLPVRILLEAVEEWTLRCLRGYRVPEPTRLADSLTRDAKPRMLALTLE